MRLKNPRPCLVEGFENHRADDAGTLSRSSDHGQRLPVPPQNSPCLRDKEEWKRELLGHIRRMRALGDEVTALQADIAAEYRRARKSGFARRGMRDVIRAMRLADAAGDEISSDALIEIYNQAFPSRRAQLAADLAGAAREASQS